MAYFHMEFTEGVVTLTLNHPPANSLSIGVLTELGNRLDELLDRDNVRVIVLHGEGRFFSAGANIKEFTLMKDEASAIAMAQRGQSVFEKVEDYPKPIIAAIHGVSFGGGLELALACHIRTATPDAKLGLPELTLGIIPGYGGTQRLPRIVGYAKACELILTSDAVTGEEALRLGLVNHVFEEADLLSKTLEMAKKIAQKSPGTVKATLDAMRSYKTSTYYEGLEREITAFATVFNTADCKEGIQAFIEKRKPHFQGK